MLTSPNKTAANKAVMQKCTSSIAELSDMVEEFNSLLPDLGKLDTVFDELKMGEYVRYVC